MEKLFFYSALFSFVSCTFSGSKGEAVVTDKIQLITLDPGHFHAALVQKESYDIVDKDVFVYAPNGTEVDEHLKKIDLYNTRKDNPTQWNQIVYRGDDFLDKMLAEKKGNVLVTAGNNKLKTNYIFNAVGNGINVLADKPMAINKEQFELLKECFKLADENNVLLYDIMTERYEIATILQKELSLISAIYGDQLQGTAQDPAIVKESVHHFYKTVSGSPLKRPAWFFDTEQEGDGIVDVTTHLVDLVQWEAFPEQIIDYETDIEMVDANRWYTPISTLEFEKVTGCTQFPDYLNKDIHNDTLKVYCNGDIIYKIKDVVAKVAVVWNFAYPEGGGDTHYSVMKGSKANLVIRQGKEQNYLPELYIEANKSLNTEDYETALDEAFKQVSEKYPNVSLAKIDEATWKLDIPKSYRIGHEAHFGQVTQKYINYLQEGELPAWEIPNMLTKYFITTSAFEMAKAKMN